MYYSLMLSTRHFHQWNDFPGRGNKKKEIFRDKRKNLENFNFKGKI